MITVKVTGDWGNTERFLKNASKLRKRSLIALLEKYGRAGVQALSEATPVRTGKTAASWGYTVHVGEQGQGDRLEFHNDNVNHGVNIALILNYGHATGSGVWIEGRNYIEPAMDKIIKSLADELWKEVKRL